MKIATTAGGNQEDCEAPLPPTSISPVVRDRYVANRTGKTPALQTMGSHQHAHQDQGRNKISGIEDTSRPNTTLSPFVQGLQTMQRPPTQAVV